ncbi:MAG TPA: nickel insertion protein, partial [Armatimonadota bacterium]|nr:nickel insertion protein [Armatimonadota bacterium]
DMPPEWYEHVMDILFAQGALDVYLLPAQMKKNRPANILGVLCVPEKTQEMLAILYRETTTLGVRVTRVERYALERESVSVQTPWGPVPVKIGRWEGKPTTYAPEYEACRRIAREKDIPLKTVYSIAQAAAQNDPAVADEPHAAEHHHHADEPHAGEHHHHPTDEPHAGEHRHSH